MEILKTPTGLKNNINKIFHQNFEEPDFSQQSQHEKTVKIPKKVSLSKTYTAQEEAFLCCKFDPKDNFIAAGSSSGSIHILSIKDLVLKSKAISSTVISSKNSLDTITSLRWKPQQGTDDKHILLSSSGNGKIIQWDASSGDNLYSIEEQSNQNICLDYNKDGSLFASAGKDKTVRIYDDNTKKVVRNLKAVAWVSPGHSNRISAIKFHSNDPNVILSAGWDKLVYLWDLRAGRNICSIYGPNLLAESIDTNENTILTGSNRNKDQLELWDFGSRKKISGIDWEFGYPHENALLTSCQFSKTNNENIIAGCAGLNQVKIFDREEQNKDIFTIKNSKNAIYCVEFSNRRNLFCFSGVEGSIKVGRMFYNEYDDF